MSDQHVVIVTVDYAPWDSDVDPVTHIYLFDGPDEAALFTEGVQEFGAELSKDGGENVGAFNPEPVRVYTNSEDALRDLIGEVKG